MNDARIGTWRLGGIGLFGAVVLLAAIAITALAGVATFTEATAEVENAYYQLDAFASLAQRVPDLQTATTAYVASSSQGRLDDMGRAERAIASDIAGLTGFEQNEPEHLGHLEALQSQIANLIKACRAAAAATLLRGRAAGGQVLQEQHVADLAVGIAAGIQAGMAREQQRLRERHDLQRRVAEHSVIVVVIGSLMALVVAVASALALYRDNRLRRHAETRFRALLECAPDAMLIVDREGQITLASAQVEAVFGWPRAELIGRPVELLVPASIDPAYPGLLAAYRAEPTSLSFGARRDLTGLRRDGTEVPVELGLSPLPNGDVDAFIVAARDVTARRVAEAELARTHREIADLYDNAPCWYQSVACDGRIVRINETGLRWLGYARGEVVGHLVSEFISGAARDEVPSYIKQFATSGHIDNLELDAVRKDSSILPVLINATAARGADGKILHTNATLVDLTELKAAREERERLIVKLQDTLAQVKTLRGLLPVCAWCKRIRDDAGYYHTLEAYIVTHSETQFTHSICPDCQRDLEAGTPL